MEDGHPTPAHSPASILVGCAQELVLKRAIDDVGHPMIRAQDLDLEGSPGVVSHSERRGVDDPTSARQSIHRVFAYTGALRAEAAPQAVNEGRGANWVRIHNNEVPHPEVKEAVAGRVGELAAVALAKSPAIGVVGCGVRRGRGPCSRPPAPPHRARARRGGITACLQGWVMLRPVNAAFTCDPAASNTEASVSNGRYTRTPHRTPQRRHRSVAQQLARRSQGPTSSKKSVIRGANVRIIHRVRPD